MKRKEDMQWYQFYPFKGTNREDWCPNKDQVTTKDQVTAKDGTNSRRRSEGSNESEIQTTGQKTHGTVRVCKYQCPQDIDTGPTFDRSH